MSISKSVISATFLITISNASVRLLSIITMPLLTRLLPPDAYGTANIIATAISLVSVLSLAGMDMSYARAYYAKDTPNGEYVESLVWQISLGMGLISGLVLSFIWWHFISKYLKLPQYLSAFVGLGVLLNVTNTLSLTRSRLNNKYRNISISIIASALSSTAVSIIVATQWRQDETALIFSLILGTLIPILILGWPKISTLTKRSTLTKSECLSVLKVGIAGVITAPAYWIISSLDRWLLGYIEGIASVGIYSIGYTVGIMGMMINNAIHSVWLPEIVKVFEDNPEKAKIDLGQLIERIIILMATVWLGITAIGGDIIRLLSDPKFHEATTLVPYIAGAVFFHGLMHLFNAGTLLKRKLHNTLPWWIGGTIVCVVLNLLLIPIFGRVGASLTQTISFAFIAFGIYKSSQKLLQLQINQFRLFIISIVIIAIGILMNKSWSDSPLQSISIKMPLLVIILLTIIHFTEPEILKKFLVKFNLIKSNKR